MFVDIEKIPREFIRTCKYSRNCGPSYPVVPEKAKIRNRKVPQMRMNTKNFGIMIALASTARQRATSVELESPSTCRDKRCNGQFQ